MKIRGFEKKNPKNSFCFKLLEIFTLTESYVVVITVSAKLIIMDQYNLVMRESTRQI
jgi:hypothetical protein